MCVHTVHKDGLREIVHNAYSDSALFIRKLIYSLRVLYNKDLGEFFVSCPLLVLLSYNQPVEKCILNQ